MSYEDFFHSMTPYNFHVKKTEEKSDDDDKKEGEEEAKEPSYFDRFTPEILELVDADKNGKIDFNEYIFFITLLQIPEGEIMKSIERLNPEGKTVNKEQFLSEFKRLRKATSMGRKQRDKSFMPDGRKITTDDGMISKCVVEHLFRGKETITINDFLFLKQKMKSALLHYEFYQFDVDENETISAEEFAKSLLSCLSLSKAHHYMKVIQTLELNGRVNFQEYLAFHNLIEKADIIKMKIAFYRYMSKSMFRELCDDFQKIDPFCKDNNVKISDVQIDTFMAVLDDDKNGMLEYDEIVDVLEGKKNIGLGKDIEFKNETLETFQKYLKKFKKLVGIV